jgi:predicted alpha-1,2-mannosidase
MLDSVFEMPPLFDESYYGFVIHEIREMQIMNMGQYAHGNQPIQHMPYLYNYAGQPWRTQFHVRKIMRQLYTATPDGYCGDEDNGQTSAWYVFSAMGFYPVCPGSNQYVTGSPLFNNVKITLENGRKLEILANHNSSENIYINSVSLNGRGYDTNWFSHEQLIKGGKIVFEMAAMPNRKRGILKEDFPYSMSNIK